MGGKTSEVKEKLLAGKTNANANTEQVGNSFGYQMPAGVN